MMQTVNHEDLHGFTMKNDGAIGFLDTTLHTEENKQLPEMEDH